MYHNLVDSMFSTIRRFSMMSAGDRVLVAVSGGPDSVALLHTLWSVRDDLGISLHVAHLNHSVRGAESDKDAEYVCQLAENIGLGCAVEKVDVPQIRKTLRLSVEEAARLVRYEFLERVAAHIGADRIALGHTADDQVETVLLNLVRGTGLDGLAGMPPVRGKIIRPLIAVRRAEIEEYVRVNDLRPRIDVTNLLAVYARNKVRLELLPLLRREYNPEIDTAILRLSELAREDTAYLNTEVEETLQRITVASTEESISVDPGGLMSYPLSIRRRIIRRAVKAVRGELANVGFIHVEEMLRLMEAGNLFEYELPGGAFVRRARGGLVFRSSRPRELPIIYCYELAVPGSTRVPEIQAIIEAEIRPGPMDPTRPKGSLEAVLDCGAVAGKLVVRNWCPGDRIRPLGMRGSKKAQDVFVDNKIPREARYRVPVIADGEKIIWMAGVAVSELAKVTDATRMYLLLRVVPA